jgi:hypothetical protein
MTLTEVRRTGRVHKQGHPHHKNHIFQNIKNAASQSQGKDLNTDYKNTNYNRQNTAPGRVLDLLSQPRSQLMGKLHRLQTHSLDLNNKTEQKIQQKPLVSVKELLSQNQNSQTMAETVQKFMVTIMSAEYKKYVLLGHSHCASSLSASSNLTPSSPPSSPACIRTNAVSHHNYKLPGSSHSYPSHLNRNDMTSFMSPPMSPMRHNTPSGISNNNTKTHQETWHSSISENAILKTIQRLVYFVNSANGPLAMNTAYGTPDKQLPSPNHILHALCLAHRMMVKSMFECSPLPAELNSPSRLLLSALMLSESQLADVQTSTRTWTMLLSEEKEFDCQTVARLKLIALDFTNFQTSVSVKEFTIWCHFLNSVFTSI